MAQHTGVVVSTVEADRWHDEIKIIMAEQGVDFADAVNLYIAKQQSPKEIGRLVPRYD